MSFTDHRTLPSIGRRVSWQTVTLAGGLAAAVSAAVLAGAFEDARSSPTTAVSRPPVERPVVTSPATHTTSAGPELVYTLVDSREKATDLKRAIDEIADHFPGVPAATLHVVAIETEAQAQAFAEQVTIAYSELADLGASVRVIDLRSNPPSAATAPAPRTAPPARTIVYVTGSAEHALHLQDALLETSRLVEAGSIAHHVIVAGSPEEDSLVNAMIREQMEVSNHEGYAHLTVVDLR